MRNRSAAAAMSFVMVPARSMSSTVSTARCGCAGAPWVLYGLGDQLDAPMTKVRP